MERFIGLARPNGMKTAAAALSVVAMLGVAACDSDTKTKSVHTGQMPTTVKVSGRMVHVGGMYPGTIGPVPGGTVRFKSSTGTFDGNVDSKGHFTMRVPRGRYDVDGALRAGTFVCHTDPGGPVVLVTGHQHPVTVYCQYR